MVKLHINYFLGSLLCLGIAIGLVSGKIQQSVIFEGVINEMAEFLLAAGLGIILLFCSFERVKTDSDGK